jgi:adenylosuccinate synthase
MANIVIVGMQWGDEGKGKVVDLLTEYADVVVRFQGGNNAGHTVVVGQETIILHLIPSGALYRDKTCVIGNGVVVDPQVLLQEIDELRKRGHFLDDRQFLISEDAHLIMPYHRRIDVARERMKGEGKIGTTGAGVGPTKITAVIGVSKAYTTRVGGGPFPTELNDAVGEKIRERGREFGATTGRPRRCGWLDIPLLKDSIRLNGLTGIALTKMDVLGEFDTIRICTAYQHRGRRIEDVPSQVQVLKECEPVYEDHPGWKADLRNARIFQDLPPQARHYVRRIEELTETKVTLVSVGEKRAETILRRNPFRQRPRRS